MGKLSAIRQSQYFNDLSTDDATTIDDDSHRRHHQLKIIEQFFCENINLNDENLIYRAEGNANLVLSLPDTRQVLRLRKTIKNEIETKG